MLPAPTARCAPTETGFNLRVALPSSQQSKGYESVNFEWAPLLLTGRSEWGRRVNETVASPALLAGGNFMLSVSAVRHVETTESENHASRAN
jgi:hypothetical protein